MSLKLKSETVDYPSFVFFVIYNKSTRTWHKGGMEKFVCSKHISGAKKYNSYSFAEKVLKSICEKGQNIDDFVILRYVAKATEVMTV